MLKRKLNKKIVEIGALQTGSRKGLITGRKKVLNELRKLGKLKIVEKKPEKKLHERKIELLPAKAANRLSRMDKIPMDLLQTETRVCECLPRGSVILASSRKQGGTLYLGTVIDGKRGIMQASHSLGIGENEFNKVRMDTQRKTKSTRKIEYSKIGHSHGAILERPDIHTYFPKIVTGVLGFK